MRKPTAIKHLGLMLLVSSFAVGCASTTEEAPPEAPAAVEPAPAPAPVEPAPTTMNYEVSQGTTCGTFQASQVCMLTHTSGP